MLTLIINHVTLFNIMSSSVPETISETSTERQAILAQIGDGLHQHLEQQSQPRTPFTSALLERLERFHFYKPNEIGEVRSMTWSPLIESDEPKLNNNLWIVMDRAAQATKWAGYLYDEEGKFVTETVLHRYAGMSHARKVLAHSDQPIDRLHAVLIPTLVAIEFKPEDWQPGQKLAKRKNATEDEEIFRIACRDLRSFYTGNSRDTRSIRVFNEYRNKLEQRYTPEEVNAYIIDALKMPENQLLRDAEFAIVLENIASDLMNIIERPEFTAESFREEMYILLQYWHNQEQPEIPVEETQWTILPPGTLEELGEGESGSHESTPDYVDPARMKWLARLAMYWGSNAYIAVANLDSTGNYDYRVAVLPERKNGVLIEHAVAENPSSGNAIYVFRGERGLEDDGTTHWLTWRQVLNDNKSGARALGARRILHGTHTDNNVLEYLTRPTQDLDKPGYKR